MTFIDLFAGLGGFHVALAELGHECVFASEINKELRETYAQNFGLTPAGDIRAVSASEIPDHDVLCAGFPCQPFSKAGHQKGLRDKERGNLFFEILRIIKKKEPTYIFLENVPHIRKQNKGKTWETIWNALKAEGYTLSSENLSPHHFGIPQVRLRTYIVGSKKGLEGFKWPVPTNKIVSVKSILENNPPDSVKIPEHAQHVLNLWQEFLDMLPKNSEIPKPLWAMEFGATYPYETTTPDALSYQQLKSYRGSFGIKLRGKTKRELYANLPSHAIREGKRFPEWKIRMIKSNREFFKKNKASLKKWIKKIQEFPPSFQKLEWNIDKEKSRKINEYLVQFRASGVRVKKLTTAPSLVAMNATQIPIIPREHRYMTPHECSKLQSLDVLKYLPKSKAQVYKALGNAVNVTVVQQIFKSLLENQPPSSRQKWRS
jgi:DNA (cytosine-5)-methyltransferase 1